MSEETVIISPEISVRHFVPRDAEGVVALIRRNYADTYYKALFYDPDAIRNANATGEIISIVAAYHETVIGHFAMVPSSFSDIAEIGAAAVDPSFKHLGVMNAMFDHLITDACERKFRAIFGEGIMLHPFSQKANLHHGMVESAIMLGEVPSSIEIEHRIKDAKRSGVVIAYRLFDLSPRSVRVPSRYHSIIETTFLNAGITLDPNPLILPPAPKTISHRYHPLLKNGFIRIDADVTASQIDEVLGMLDSAPCDMIFADISLCRIASIDSLIDYLNRQKFFYCGIMFAFYGGEDYLRLQRKNSGEIDEENLFCYSEFAEKLLAFILRDEASLDQ